VLGKCANPVCHIPFRYLHQGKLLEVEIQYSEGRLSNGKGYVERCWLCDQCSAHIALQFDSRRGVLLLSSLGERGEVIATSILPFGGKLATEIARVLIRPSDLTLKLSPRREPQVS
jgi:hypothetical protein